MGVTVRSHCVENLLHRYVGEGWVALDKEKNTIFPERPVLHSACLSSYLSYFVNQCFGSVLKYIHYVSISVTTRQYFCSVFENKYKCTHVCVYISMYVCIYVRVCIATPLSTPLFMCMYV